MFDEKFLTDLDLNNIAEDLNDFSLVSIDTLKLLYWGVEASRTFRGMIGVESYEAQNAFIDRIKDAIKARTYEKRG